MSTEENNCFICWESLNKKKFGKKKLFTKMIRGSTLVTKNV